MIARGAVKGRAARSGLALVTGRGEVLEVDAARPLHEVPGRRGEIAQLRGGSREQRPRQHRVALADQGITRQLGIADRRSDSHPAVGQLLHPAEPQPGDIHEQARASDAQLHVIDEVSAAAEKHGVRASGDRGHSSRDVQCALVGELTH